MCAGDRHKTLGRRLHNALVPGVDLERAIFRAVIPIGSIGQLHIPDISLRSTQTVFLYLMAHRTGHPIGSRGECPMILRERQSAEHLRFATGGAIYKVLHRHVAGGAFILDFAGDLGVIDGFAADAALPVRVAR